MPDEADPLTDPLFVHGAGKGYQLQLWGLGAAIKQVNANDAESGPGWELGVTLCGHPITHLFKEST